MVVLFYFVMAVSNGESKAACRERVSKMLFEYEDEKKATISIAAHKEKTETSSETPTASICAQLDLFQAASPNNDRGAAIGIAAPSTHPSFCQ